MNDTKALDREGLKYALNKAKTAWDSDIEKGVGDAKQEFDSILSEKENTLRQEIESANQTTKQEIDSAKEELTNSLETRLSDSIPSGLIAMWSGKQIPTGWKLCDGQNGTPDLSDKFIMGASTADNIGETGGNDRVTLSIENLPAHTHGVSGASVQESTIGGSLFDSGDDIVISTSITSEETGSSEPFSILPPYYILAFIMKI